MNVVCVRGNVVRSELKYAGTGTAILTFSVAVDMREKENGEWVKKAHYFECVMFGKGAEVVGKVMEKGQKVTVQGELRQNRWEHNGEKRQKVVIAAREAWVEKKGRFTEDVPF